MPTFPQSCSIFSLKLLHVLLQLSGNPIWVAAGCELNRQPDVYPDLPGAGKFLASSLYLEQSVNSHGYDRHCQIIRQQPNPGTERTNFAVSGVMPFRKNQNTVTAIHRLTRVSKALAEARLPG